MTYSLKVRGRIPLKGGDRAKRVETINCEEMKFNESGTVVLKRVEDIEELPDWMSKASNIFISEGLADMVIINREGDNENITVYVGIEGHVIE